MVDRLGSLLKGHSESRSTTYAGCRYKGTGTPPAYPESDSSFGPLSPKSRVEANVTMS